MKPFSKKTTLKVLDPFFQKKRPLPQYSILSLLFLSACGGGGSSSSDGEQPAASTNYSGAVVKGPLQNALVFLDYDNDGVLDANEPSVRSSEDGSYVLTGTVSGASFVAQTDNTTVDTSSGEILADVVLKAPEGSEVITPTTTIMKEANLSKEEALKRFNEYFHLLIHIYILYSVSSHQ